MAPGPVIGNLLSHNSGLTWKAQDKSPGPPPLTLNGEAVGMTCHQVFPSLVSNSLFFQLNLLMVFSVAKLPFFFLLFSGHMEECG